MKIRLEKKNRVTTDFVSIEVKECFLYFKSGKIRKSGTVNSTKCCVSNKSALDELEKIKQEYLAKKYIEVTVKQKKEDFNGVYDKAKWHYDGGFPNELDKFQGFVHTGFYITWLADNNFIDTNYIPISEIEKIKSREISGTVFYKNYLDGVLTDDDISEIGNEFTYSYYEKGTFIDDYNNTLGEDKNTLYHIEDNWKNYEILKPIIDKRYIEFLKPKKKKWWKL